MLHVFENVCLGAPVVFFVRRFAVRCREEGMVSIWAPWKN
jgi:hypothetical protein